MLTLKNLCYVSTELLQDGPTNFIQKKLPSHVLFKHERKISLVKSETGALIHH